MLLFAAACGSARFARIPGVMRGVTFTCADSSSEIVRTMRSWAIGYTVPRSPRAEEVRVGLHLPRIAADSVQPVVDASVCARAGLAYASSHRQRLATGTYQTAVVRAGGRYIVRSVTAPEPLGEWNSVVEFDERFRLESGILGF